MLVDTVGWIAAALTLLTFSMRSMLPLRLIGMAANLAFIAYGIAAQLYPVVVLHVLLLPCNLLRFCQIYLSGEGASAHAAPLPLTGGGPRQKLDR